jgi:hypothetical protein
VCRVLCCARLLECGDLSPLLGVLACGDLSPLLVGPLRGVPGEVRIGAGSGDQTPGRPNKSGDESPHSKTSPQYKGVYRHYCPIKGSDICWKLL